jgi:NAD(P)-dependent dehydrogenase (short-subunit alcohol dehydrogenase family)
VQLAGTVALVTGGPSGLGFATASTLAEAGAAVVIADLPGSPGESAAAQIGGVFVPTDVTDEASVQVPVAQATSMGALPVAVNCVGVGTPGRVLGKKGH